MISRYGFACYGFPLLALLAGCTPDRVAAPTLHSPAAPAADISRLSGTDPLLYDQSSSDGAYISMASDAGAHQGDDFEVPAGETWTVTQVALSGLLGMETLPFAIRANRRPPMS